MRPFEQAGSEGERGAEKGGGGELREPLKIWVYVGIGAVAMAVVLVYWKIKY